MSQNINNSSQKDSKYQMEYAKQQKTSVTAAAALIAVGTLSSRLLGLIRDSLMMAFFPRIVTDAWIVAFRLPNLFRRLLGEGSLSVSFIPVFVECIHSPNGDREAKTLTNEVFTILMGVLSFLTVVGIVWMKPFMAILVSGEGYMDVPGKFELTISLGRIMFVFIFLMSTYAYFMAILNSLKKFAWPAIAPCFFNICLIISTLIPASFAKLPGMFLAWGVVIGGVFQTGVLIPQLMKTGFFPKFTIRFRTNATIKVFKAIVPSLLGMGILQLTGLVNIHFASYLPQGCHSWIYAADRVLELPLSLFAVSFGSALLPTLSKQWATGERLAMGETALESLRLILFLTIPAAVGTYFMAQPIVEVLFMRKLFSLEDAQQTALILKVYSLVILTNSLMRILATAFYAIHNTWLPALFSLISLLIHIVIAPIFIKKFGVSGLPISTVITAAINVILLAICYRIIIGPLLLKRFFISFLKFSSAACIMILTIQIYDPAKIWFGADSTAKIIALLITIVGAVVTYFIASFAFRVEELKYVKQIILNKLSKVFSNK